MSAVLCVRCLGVLTDDDVLVRVPFGITGQANVAHAECPSTDDDRGSAPVSLVLGMCIAGGLLLLALISAGQHGMCQLHDQALAYCDGYTTSPAEETSR